MPQALPTTPGYVPRSRSNALKDIVEDHYEELLRVYDEKFRSTYVAVAPEDQRSPREFHSLRRSALRISSLAVL